MDKNKLEITQKTAKQIKYYRTMAGLSQKSLAILTGLNPSFLGHIERCLKCPTIDTLSRIATAFDISLSQLLDFDGETAVVNDNEKAIEKIMLSIRGLSAQEVEEVAAIITKIIKFKQNN